MNDRILVVGAGFAGACYARTLAEANYRVHIIDQRDHIGGNAFDFVDENGIRRHKYGPHLFHTNNHKVVEWLSQFGTWIPYYHKVRAKIKEDVYVPLPVNLDTINSFFGVDLQDELAAKEFLRSLSIPNTCPANAAEHLYSTIGVRLTDTFFRRYTKKMWNLDLEQMSADVVKRLPLRFDKNDLYFPDDKYQFLPKDGYTSVFNNILSHRNISIELNASFSKKMEHMYKFIFNSMPIDEYFDYSFGELPYRSIKFHHKTVNHYDSYLPSVINFTDDGPLTRMTSWHLMPYHINFFSGKVTHTFEEPCDYKDNNKERYYPVKTSDGIHDRTYKKYKALADDLNAMIFIGRCGTYQYLDMHQVINQSLVGAYHWLARSP